MQYDADSYKAECERLNAYASTDYIGYYGVQEETTYELLAVNADPYYGFVYALTDGEGTIIYAEQIFCNYYIAIMVCIFILLYYPVYYFITVRDRGAKACLLTTLRAVAASLIGIGMSAVMLLPTYISMQNAYYFSSEMPEEWSFYYNVLDVLNQLLPTAHLTHLDGLPNLCCGFLVTVMLACYFMSREIPYREKMLHGAFLVFMFFSLNINKLDFVWHGMHFPNQLPHRFSFVICFLLVAMGYRAFNRLNGIGSGKLMAVFIVIGAYYILAQKILTDVVDDMNVFVYYGLALTVAYGILFGLYKRQMLVRRQFIALLAVVVAAELCVTTTIDFDRMGNSSRVTYNENKASVMRLAGEACKESGPVSDGGNGRLARMEIDDPIIHNCPAFYHYRGMGQFASTLNSNTTTLMERIGLEGHPGSNRFNFNKTSPVTSCITNVDYMITKNLDLNDPDYTYLKGDEESGLYESNYPLSIGYMLPASIRAWDPYDPNPFINLDEYVNAATSGAVEQVFINKGKNDGLYITLPNYKSKESHNGKPVYKEIVTMGSDLKKQVSRAMIDEYHKSVTHKELNRFTIKSRLNEAKKKADEQTAHKEHTKENMMQLV